MFLIGIPVVILGAVVVYPAINSFMESVFSAGTFATAIPPEVATEASIAIPSLVPATRTPQPTPIAINSPGICLNGPGVEIYSPRVEGNNIIWSFFNGDDEVVDMEFAIDDFPEINASLLSIKMGESTIWEGSESDPALVELGEASLQQLATSKVTEFSLEFALAPANNGYQITLDFGVGCVIKAEW
jgi:hypothetical protein